MYDNLKCISWHDATLYITSVQQIKQINAIANNLLMRIFIFNYSSAHAYIQCLFQECSKFSFILQQEVLITWTKTETLFCHWNCHVSDRERLWERCVYCFEFIATHCCFRGRLVLQTCFLLFQEKPYQLQC